MTAGMIGGIRWIKEILMVPSPSRAQPSPCPAPKGICPLLSWIQSRSETGRKRNMKITPLKSPLKGSFFYDNFFIISFLFRFFVSHRFAKRHDSSCHARRKVLPCGVPALPCHLPSVLASAIRRATQTRKMKDSKSTEKRKEKGKMFVFKNKNAPLRIKI